MVTGIFADFGVGIGTLPAWLTILGLIILAVFMYKGQAGPAVRYLSDTNQALERQVEGLKERLEEAENQIKELQSKTDVSIAIEPIVKWTTFHEESDQRRHDQMVNAFAPMLKALELHEDRAETRMERTLILLEMISAKLGSESHNDDEK